MSSKESESGVGRAGKEVDKEREKVTKNEKEKEGRQTKKEGKEGRTKKPDKGMNELLL